MNRKRGPKNIPWEAVSAKEWAQGYGHVASLFGVTPQSARTAHMRMLLGLTTDRRKMTVPEDLRPGDCPAAVARIHGVSAYTARKWLASIGRQPGGPGRRIAE